MKTAVTTLCMAMALGAAAAGAAQSGAMDKDQMDGKGTMKGGQMTMSGCVAAGKESGHYMLNNAMMMDKGMMDKDKGMMKEPGMAGGHMMSYELVGGDMKAHMGHKVEVTGTMSKSDMDRMMKMKKTNGMEKDKMDHGKMDKMSDMDMKPMKFNVKSVKMVSASCP